MRLMLKLRERTDADSARGWVPAKLYDIVVDGNIVGQIQLRLGRTEHMRLYGGQVGYAIDPDHRGRGYAAAALRALRAIAISHGFDEIWITSRPDNVASRRTLERAGARYVETVTVPAGTDLHGRGDLDMCRYTLDLGAS